MNSIPTIRLFFFAVASCLLTINAHSNNTTLGEGWHEIDPEPITIHEWLAQRKSKPVTGNALSQFTALAQSANDPASVATTSAASSKYSYHLVELARGLKHDPLLIYEYVKNRYHWSPYFGYLKGPTRTHLDEAGNSMDQAVLLGALLEIASAENSAINSPEIVVGTVSIPQNAVANWLGCDNDPELIEDFFSDGHIPFEEDEGDYTIQQAWVRVHIEEVVHELYPAFKSYQPRLSVNLSEMIGFDAEVLSNIAGGTDGDAWVEGLNQEAVEGYLTERAMALHALLKSDHANKPLDNIVGRLKIQPQEIHELPTSIGFSSVEVTSFPLGNTPSEFLHNVTFTYEDIEYETTMDKLGVSDLYLAFEGDGVDVNETNLGSPFDAGVLGLVRSNDQNSFKVTFVNPYQSATIRFENIRFENGVASNLSAPELSSASFTLSAGQSREFIVTYTGAVEGGDTVSLSYDLFHPSVSGGSVGLGHSISFRSNQAAQLYLNDDKVASEGSSSSFPFEGQLFINVDHPSENASDTSYSYRILRGGIYALITGFGESGNGGRLRLAQERLGQLQDAASDPSQAYLAANLEMIGQSWLQETSLIHHLLAECRGYRATYFQRLGIVAQSSGYFIDLKNQISAASNLSKNSVSRSLSSGGMLQSLLEHITLEHLQDNAPAISTVKIFLLANQAGQRIYRLDSSNVGSVIGELEGYTGIEESVAQGNTIILPQSSTIEAGDWSGFGYFLNKENLFGAIIGGGHHGGYSYYAQDFKPKFILDSSLSINDNLFTDSHYSVFGGDPVLLQEGSFYHNTSLLRVGNREEPLGLEFSINYNSARKGEQSQLGGNWNHSYDCQIKENTLADVSLGRRQASDAVVALTGIFAITALETEDTAKSWLLRAMVANWVGDNYKDGVASFRRGGDTKVFAKLPDGSFNPPPGVTASLGYSDDRYTLRERFGKSYKFDLIDEEHRLVEIGNTFGQRLLLSYESGRLATVTDEFGRKLYFTYQDDLLISVADDYERSVGFEHSAEKDLTAYTDVRGFRHSYDYVEPGRIGTVYNPDLEIVTQNIYAESGKVGEQLSQGNNLWQYLYTPFSTVLIDPVGAEEIYQYSESGVQTKHTNAEGYSSRSFQNGHNLAVAQIGPRGERLELDYDNSLNVTEERRFLDVENSIGRKLFYDDEHRLNRITDERDNEWKITHNEHHQILTETDPLDFFTENIWNSDGTLHKFIDQEGFETVYVEYDFHFNPLHIRYPDGSEEFYTWSELGDQLTYSDPRGNTWTYTWDEARNRTSMTDPLGEASSWTYHHSNKVETATDPESNKTSNTYNSLNKITEITYADDTSVTISYDERDEEVSRTTEEGRTTTFMKDKARRQIGVIDPLNFATHFKLDGSNNVIEIRDANDEIITLNHDLLNRNTDSTNPRKEKIIYGFDSSSNRVSLTNAKGAVFESQFDPRSFETHLTTPEGHTKQTVYGPRGLVQEIIYPSGKMVLFVRDQMGRVIERTDDDGTLTYTRDANGNIVTISDGERTASYVFDDLNRPIRYESGLGHIGYSYSPAGNLESKTYPGGRVVQYTYTSLNQLESVTDWFGNISRFYYSPDGFLTEIQLPNGTRRTIERDIAGRITELRDFDATGSTIQLYQYKLDPVGKIVAKRSLPVHREYNIYRGEIAVDLRNGVTSYNGQSVEINADGNMTYGPSPTSESFTEYVFSADNQLFSTGDVSYEYSVDDHRIEVASDNGIMQAAVDPNASLSQVLSLTKVNGEQTDFIYGLGLLYELNEAGEVFSYHYNSSGSTTAIVGADGVSVLKRAQYSPYGEVTHTEGYFDTPFLFIGRFGVQTDPNGLCYMRNRYYDPIKLKRFINQDPIGFQGGLNWFAYADGNAISLIDPIGLGADVASSFYGPPHIPVFNGFEDARYQEHDALIVSLVNGFHANSAAYTGGGSNPPSNISAALIKSHWIQETGGNDPNSLNAWKVDPGQVNVPGDWSKYKTSIGLSEPSKRNEGNLNANANASLMWLTRKGYGVSGQPLVNRPNATFDGWSTALQRYNGRTGAASNGKAYSENYRDRILERANNLNNHYPIELP